MLNSFPNICSVVWSHSRKFQKKYLFLLNSCFVHYWIVEKYAIRFKCILRTPLIKSRSWDTKIKSDTNSLVKCKWDEATKPLKKCWSMKCLSAEKARHFFTKIPYLLCWKYRRKKNWCLPLQAFISHRIDEWTVCMAYKSRIFCIHMCVFVANIAKIGIIFVIHDINAQFVVKSSENVFKQLSSWSEYTGNKHFCVLLCNERYWNRII